MRRLRTPPPTGDPRSSPRPSWLAVVRRRSPRRRSTPIQARPEVARPRDPRRGQRARRGRRLPRVISFTNGLLPSGSLPQWRREPSSPPAPTAACGWRRRSLPARAAVRGRRRPDRLRRPHAGRLRRVGEDRLPRRAARRERRKAEREPVPRSPRSAPRLDRLARAWTLSGAKPTSTAGRPSYTVRIAPKDDGGLLGAGELAWDAVKGVPLRAAVYAQDSDEPVLELAANDISFGRVPDGDLRFSVPPSTRTVDVDPPAGPAAPSMARTAPRRRGGPGAARLRAHRPAGAGGPAAPGRPARGRRRRARRAERLRRGPGRDRRAPARGRPGEAGGRRRGRAPEINIDGATGTELATALGTVVTFERGGVELRRARLGPAGRGRERARGSR